MVKVETDRGADSYKNADEYVIGSGYLRIMAEDATSGKKIATYTPGSWISVRKQYTEEEGPLSWGEKEE